MGTISQVEGEVILDSRGEWTLEVSLFSSSGEKVSASVPHGKSVGEGEAVTLPAEEALRKVTQDIAPHLVGKDFPSQESLDKTLLELDGTKDKSRLGANSLLGISLAFSKLLARSKNVPLWEYYTGLLSRDISDRPVPKLFGNLINGGLHAEGNLPFQEYLVIPQTKTFREGSEMLRALYLSLHEKHPERFSLVGDEGGYAGTFSSPLEPFEILFSVAKELGISEHLRFGLDAAANNVDIPPQQLSEWFRRMVQEFNLFYLEDPFPEGDDGSFTRFQEEFPEVYICGDDLTTTSAPRIKMMREKGAIRAAIIKPNQIGTLTETFDAIRECIDGGIEWVVSHRSGETNDTTIADIAVGTRSLGIKLGAPARGERIAKYNRLLEIEDTLLHV